MQGRLRNEKLSFSLETECGHCGLPIKIELDSDLNFKLLDAETGSGSHAPPWEAPEPLIFSPQVDIHQLEPSIIDGF